MAKKTGTTPLQAIIVSITILATILGLLGLSFFSSYTANQKPAAPQPKPQAQTQVPISISDITTSGGGKVEVVPNPVNTPSK